MARKIANSKNMEWPINKPVERLFGYDKKGGDVKGRRKAANKVFPAL